MEQITKEQLVTKREEVDKAYDRFAALQMGNALGLRTEQKVDAEIALLTARNAWLTKQEEYAALLDRYVHQQSARTDDTLPGDIVEHRSGPELPGSW